MYRIVFIFFVSLVLNASVYSSEEVDYWKQREFDKYCEQHGKITPRIQDYFDRKVKQEVLTQNHQLRIKELHTAKQLVIPQVEKWLRWWYGDDSEVEISEILKVQHTYLNASFANMEPAKIYFPVHCSLEELLNNPVFSVFENSPLNMFFAIEQVYFMALRYEVQNLAMQYIKEHGLLVKYRNELSYWAGRLNGRLIERVLLQIKPELSASVVNQTNLANSYDQNPIAFRNYTKLEATTEKKRLAAKMTFVEFFSILDRLCPYGDLRVAEKLNSTLKQAKTDLGMLRGEKMGVQALLHSEKVVNQKMQCQLDALRDKLATSESRNAVLANGKKTAEKKAATNGKRAKSAKAKVVSLEQKIKELRNKLSLAEGAIKVRESNAQALSQAKQKITELKKALKESKARETAGRAENRELIEQVESLKTKLSEEEAVATDWALRHKKQRAALRAQTSHTKRLEKAVEALKAEVAGLEKCKKNMASQLSKRKKEDAKLRQEVASAEAKGRAAVAEEMEASFDKLASAITKLREGLQEQQLQTSELTRKLKEKDATIDHLINESEARDIMLQALKVQMNEKLRLKDEELEKLREQISSKAKNLDEVIAFFYKLNRDPAPGDMQSNHEKRLN